MPTTLQDMMTQASAAVPRLPPEEVRAKLAQGAVLLDVREPTEVASGKIAGAVVIPRGLLEFQADPSSPNCHPALRTDATVLVYCASGGRSALAGRTLKELGFGEVYNAGGFRELAACGLPVEPG
jgi:rhodanese-related sulfurtransferase